MIRPSELKAFACRYHRNGVMGDGFYLCQFKWRGTGNTFALQAVLFPGDADLSTLTGFCAVLDPLNLQSRWRGDEFEPAIREKILAYGDRAFADEPRASPTASEPKIRAE